MKVTQATRNMPPHPRVRHLREHRVTAPGEGATRVRSRQGTDPRPAATLSDAAAGSLERFHALFEALPDAMVVVDETGTIVLVNTQLERLFGYERGELPGRSVDILVPERLRNSHRGHRARYFTAPTVRAMGSAGDLPAARKDGQEFPVEISLSPFETDGGMLVICSFVMSPSSVWRNERPNRPITSKTNFSRRCPTNSEHP